MPEITFQDWTSLPTIALLDSDYFAEDGPPDLPEVPEMPEIDGSPLGDLQRRATEAVEKFLGNVGDIEYAPTPLDINGADLGMRIGQVVANNNKRLSRDNTFYDICLLIMNGDPSLPDGFMVAYNAIVQEYARALYQTTPIFFATDPIGRNATLNTLFTQYKQQVNGLVRGTQAALRAAYGVAATNADLDMGNVQTITREGKVPGDFASMFN